MFDVIMFVDYVFSILFLTLCSFLFITPLIFVLSRVGENLRLYFKFYCEKFLYYLAATTGWFLLLNVFVRFIYLSI